MTRLSGCTAIVCLVTSVIIGCNDKRPSVPVTTGTDPAATNGLAEMSKDDFAQALRLKNQGIGHLENKEWTEADTAFSQLAKVAPQTLLANRNLAISRVLALVDSESPFTRSGPPQNAARHAEAVQAAMAAVNTYAEFAQSNYDKGLSLLLKGQLSIHDDSPATGGFKAGLQYLKQAADILPDAADFRFALAMAMDGHRDYTDANTPQAAEMLTAFQTSFQLAPQNLFALQKLMQRQALCLRSTNETTKQQALQITDTLKAAADLLAPLNESILKQRRMDLVDTINKALASFDGTNEAALMGPAMMTSNLLLPEIACQIDQRRLNRNLLEYLLLDFDQDFLANATQAGLFEQAEASVLTSLTKSEPLPGVSGISQLQLLDFNLDGLDDLVTLRNGRIEVLSRPDSSSTDWQLLLTSPENAITATGFVLADIDRDYDKTISELRSPQLLLDRDGDRKIVQDPVQQRRWFDTDYDIVLYGKDGVTVLRNQLQEDQTRTLEVVPQEAKTAAVNHAVAADMDADGDLDLVFATETGLKLWQNTDGTNFADISSRAASPELPIGYLSACDWDRNIAIDVVGIPQNEGSGGLLQNILHGRYRWINDDGLKTVSAGTQIVIDQLDGKGAWDVVAAGQNGLTVTTTNGGSDTEVTTALTSTLSTDPALGVRLADLDNDGHSDIIAWSSHSLDFYRGLGDGEFMHWEQLSQPAEHIRDVTTGDIDEDGDLDVLYVAGSDSSSTSLTQLLNEGGNTNHWISVVARGKPDDEQFKSRRVNAHATGAVIEVRCGDQYQAHLISDARIHIGLGNCEKPDSIRIIWTDGVPQNVMTDNLLRPQIGVLAPQILLGSCPYIYTWNGERFEFFSDCLWAAPLGLVQANGELAPTREWENLLIPEDALIARDNEYVLQLTEELWETAYFDEVQLTAVDYPADVEIFGNEKVGPAHLAKHRLHTVRNARLPQSITDGRGHDLLPGLMAQDGDYVQAFDQRVMQGLTDEWVMQFDLGRLDSPHNIRLFLVGWVFPTDTSLNVGIHQNPGIAPPSPPSIEVPDGRNGWKVARPFIGFPSGKTKAMVVDITDIFDSNTTDYRFRLRSSMELYWDRAFYTVNEEDAETVVQTCNLADADLHYRGFSRRIYADNALFRNGRAPESYDYSSVTTSPRWPPIGGRFTRYGKVSPLLTAHDDMMVVMGPGDELTVRFDVPAEPTPAGMKRAFVLTNVGFDKDANLNTIYGQSSEPFPFRSMTSYPFAPGESEPTSSDYQTWLQKWQTRRYLRKPFWNDVSEAVE